MPDAIKTLALRDLTEEDRQHYRVSYKTAVVAEQIRAGSKCRSANPGRACFRVPRESTAMTSFVSAGRYSLIGTHYRDTGGVCKEKGICSR